MTAVRGERLAPYRAIQKRRRPNRRQFEMLIAEALEGLPAEFRRRLENIAIVVENWPPSHRSARQGDRGLAPLLGIYQGTPLGQRGTNYHLVPPDRITIYRGPILAQCRGQTEVVREVRDTLLHEVGHYFGLDEKELP